MKTRVLVVLILIFSSISTFADFQTGLEAYHRGEITIALKEWRSRAKQGDM